MGGKGGGAPVLWAGSVLVACCSCDPCFLSNCCPLSAACAANSELMRGISGASFGPCVPESSPPKVGGIGGGGLAVILISTPLHSLVRFKGFSRGFYVVYFVLLALRDFNTSLDLHYHAAHYVRLNVRLASGSSLSLRRNKCVKKCIKNGTVDIGKTLNVNGKHKLHLSLFFSLSLFIPLSRSLLDLSLFIKRAGNLTQPTTTSKYFKEQNKQKRVRKILLNSHSICVIFATFSLHRTHTHNHFLIFTTLCAFSCAGCFSLHTSWRCVLLSAYTNSGHQLMRTLPYNKWGSF